MNQDSLSMTPSSLSQALPDKPWVLLNFDILDLFTSHFPSDNKLLKAKFSSSSSFAKIAMQHAVIKRNRDRKTNFKSYEELNMQIQTGDNHLFWSKVTPETIKLHFTYGTPFGIDSYGGKIWKIYTSAATTRNLLNPSFKIGILGHLPNSNTFLDFRMRYNVGEFSNQKYFYCKGCYQWKGFHIGGLAALDVKRKLLQKNDIKVGYQLGPNAWVGAQLQVDGFRNYKINYYRLGGYFDFLKLSYIHKFQGNKWVCGLKYDHNLESSEMKKIEAVIEHQLKEGEGINNLKARISSTLEVAFAGSYSLGKEIEIGWGGLWGRSTSSKLMPSSIALSFRFGKE